MIETAPLARITFRHRQTVAGSEEFGSARIASRVIEFLLAAGGPQERFAAITSHMAENFGFAPGVAAEVRAIGQEVASLSLSSFAKLQDIAWADCRDAQED